MYRDSYYGVLHLPLNATTGQIEEKAHQLEQALLDLACAGDVQAVLKIREIREARKALCHPSYRATYDRAYVAAIAAHLRYEPPHLAEAAAAAPVPPDRETWMVMDSEPQVVAAGKALFGDTLLRLRRVAAAFHRQAPIAAP